MLDAPKGPIIEKENNSKKYETMKFIENLLIKKQLKIQCVQELQKEQSLKKKPILKNIK